MTYPVFLTFGAVTLTDEHGRTTTITVDVSEPDVGRSMPVGAAGTSTNEPSSTWISTRPT